MKVAVYPGSFDPITNGHLDILDRATKVFDQVHVAILVNPNKKCLFSSGEREEMIRSAIGERENIIVQTHNGLLVDYAEQVKASAIIRGLRAVSDFDYEFQLALINRKLNDSIETVCFMTSENYTFLNSGLIKQLMMFGGDVSTLVPSIVAIRLKEKLKSS